MTSSSSCVDLCDVYTIKELHTRFKGDPSPLIAKPSDVVTMYYFSSVVYYDYLIKDGLFPKVQVDLRVRQGNETPMVMCAKLDNVTVISIRGTKTPEDVLADSHAFTLDSSKSKRKSKRVPANLRALVPVAYVDLLFDSVHYGMARRALECLSLILDLVVDDKGRDIRLYGHSLGAACAVVIAHLLKSIGYARVACYCMSCPTVFKSAFVEAARIDEYKHVYTRGDAVVEETGVMGRLRFQGFGKAYRMYGAPHENVRLALPATNEDRPPSIKMSYAHTLYYAESDLLPKPAVGHDPRIVLAKDVQLDNLDVCSIATSSDTFSFRFSKVHISYNNQHRTGIRLAETGKFLASGQELLRGPRGAWYIWAASG